MTRALASQTPAQLHVSDRGVARRQGFLRAARAVFLEQGYEAASVNDVVCVAGGSLATLYAQFASKENLFLAVCEEQREQAVAAMTPPFKSGALAAPFSARSDAPPQTGTMRGCVQWCAGSLTREKTHYCRRGRFERLGFRRRARVRATRP